MWKRNPDLGMLVGIGALIGLAWQAIAMVLLDQTMAKAILIPFGTTALTIAGAIIVATTIEGYKRKLDETTTRSAVQSTLEELRVALLQAGRPLREGVEIDVAKLPVIVAFERLSVAIELLSLIRKDMKITDIKLGKACVSSRRGLTREQSTLDRERRLLMGGRATAAVLQIAHEKLTALAGAAIPYVTIVIADLGGKKEVPAVPEAAAYMSWPFGMNMPVQCDSRQRAPGQ